MEAKIYVQNLKCNGCAKTILNKLSENQLINKLNVDVENSLITFICDDVKILDEVKVVLKSIGYPEINEENSLLTKGKSYVSCALGKI